MAIDNKLINGEVYTPVYCNSSAAHACCYCDLRNTEHCNDYDCSDNDYYDNRMNFAFVKQSNIKFNNGKPD